MQKTAEQIADYVLFKLAQEEIEEKRRGFRGMVPAASATAMGAAAGGMGGGIGRYLGQRKNQKAMGMTTPLKKINPGTRRAAGKGALIGAGLGLGAHLLGL